MKKTVIIKQINVQTGEIEEDLIEAERVAKINANAINTLNSTDWKVIRELERLMLTGTELNIEREKLRASIV